MVSSLAAIVTLAASGIALVTFVVLHVLPTGLRALHDPVSQYGISRYRFGYRILTVTLGIAGCAAAVAVLRRYPPSGRVTIVVLLVVFGVLRLVISWWPMDAPRSRPTSTGRAHLLLAIGAFVAITLATQQMRRSVQSADTFAHAYAVALIVAMWFDIVGLVGLVITRRLQATPRYFGAAERLVYAGIFVALIASGIALA